MKARFLAGEPVRIVAGLSRGLTGIVVGDGPSLGNVSFVRVAIGVTERAIRSDFLQRIEREAAS